MHRLLPLCLACLLPAALAAPAVPTAATMPNYIRETATRYQLEAGELWRGSDAWPWLVWHNDQPVRLRDQNALIRYLQADPSIPFGLWQLRLADFPGKLSLAQATLPRVQAELAARRLHCRHAFSHAPLLRRAYPAGLCALWRLAAAHQRGHRQ